MKRKHKDKQMLRIEALVERVAALEADLARELAYISKQHRENEVLRDQLMASDLGTALYLVRLALTHARRAQEV